MMSGLAPLDRRRVAGSSGSPQSKRCPSSSSRFGKPWPPTMTISSPSICWTLQLSYGHDLAQLRQDQIEDLGQAQRAPERLGCRAERLGLLARGALGLEQPRVLDRHRRLGGECRRELRELLVVEVGLELVDADDADDSVADDHRRADPAADASAAVDLAREMRMVRHVGEDLLPLRPHDLAAGVGLVVQVEADAEKRLQIVEAAPAHDHQAIALDHLHGSSCRRARLVAARRGSSRTCPPGSASFPSTCVTANSVSARKLAVFRSTMRSFASSSRATSSDLVGLRTETRPGLSGGFWCFPGFTLPPQISRELYAGRAQRLAV